MAYRRAVWKSGLTYQQTCRTCGTHVQYMDDKLDFRPWYPDGFVYCPVCKSPLRHNEAYAINGAPKQVVPSCPPSPVATQTQPQIGDVDQAQINSERFCSKCGKAFKDGDNFCSVCGNKRS